MTATADRRAAPRKVLVVGIGNPDRGDDGIGVAVARKLAGQLPIDVGLLARTGNMLSLIDDWNGFDALVCVDASAAGTAFGRVRRIDLASDALPREPFKSSSHAFGILDVVGLAHTLGLAPRDIIIYTIEGRCFAAGAPMTSEVATAANDVVDQVIAEVNRLRLA
jgi:hydrogenase maturation protease